MHHLANSGQLQLQYVRHVLTPPQAPLAQPAAMPDTVMSSFLDGSCALTAQMNLLAALETKKKPKLVLITHNVSACFTVDCSSLNTTCDYLIPRLQVLHHIWHSLVIIQFGNISLIQLTYIKLLLSFHTSAVC